MYIRKNQFYIVIAVVVVLMALFITYSIRNGASSNNEVDDAIKLVEEFGGTLKNVSLLAPRDLVIEAIKESYSPYVTDELLQKWINSPRSAPGKTTSSPWPQRIEVTEINRLSEDEYSIKGRIAEVTSTEAESGGAFAFRPIELIVRRVENKWLIDEVTIYNYE